MSIRKLQKTDYNKRYLELLNQLKPIIRYDQEIFNNIFEDISNDIRHTEGLLNRLKAGFIYLRDNKIIFIV